MHWRNSGWFSRTAHKHACCELRSKGNYIANSLHNATSNFLKINVQVRLRSLQNIALLPDPNVNVMRELATSATQTEFLHWDNCHTIARMRSDACLGLRSHSHVQPNNLDHRAGQKRPVWRPGLSPVIHSPKNDCDQAA